MRPARGADKSALLVVTNAKVNMESQPSIPPPCLITGKLYFYDEIKHAEKFVRFTLFVKIQFFLLMFHDKNIFFENYCYLCNDHTFVLHFTLFGT